MIEKKNKIKKGYGYGVTCEGDISIYMDIFQYHNIQNKDIFQTTNRKEFINFLNRYNY